MGKSKKGKGKGKPKPYIEVEPGQTALIMSDAEYERVRGALGDAFEYRSTVRMILGSLVMMLGLASAPAYAQDAQPMPPQVGCHSNGCGIYVFKFGWPRPTVGVNVVEFFTVEAQAGLAEVWGRPAIRPLGGVCLIPRVGEAMGPACTPVTVGG